MTVYKAIRDSSLRALSDAEAMEPRKPEETMQEYNTRRLAKQSSFWTTLQSKCEVDEQVFEQKTEDRRRPLAIAAVSLTSTPRRVAHGMPTSRCATVQSRQGFCCPARLACGNDTFCCAIFFCFSSLSLFCRSGIKAIILCFRNGFNTKSCNCICACAACTRTTPTKTCDASFAAILRAPNSECF